MVRRNASHPPRHVVPSIYLLLLELGSLRSLGPKATRVACMLILFFFLRCPPQPWTQGNYSDLLVRLSDVYSKIRGDTSGEKNEDDAQARSAPGHCPPRCVCLA